MGEPGTVRVEGAAGHVAGWCGLLFVGLTSSEWLRFQTYRSPPEVTDPKTAACTGHQRASDT